MEKVSSATLPRKSQLYSYVEDADFLDCYAVQSNRSVREAAEIILNFPGWVRALTSLRNVLVAPLGLTTDAPMEGEKIGLFPIESETEHELIAGFNDKHLEFRLSVLSDEGKVFLSTWVHPHNLGGRLYLGLVMPFHIIIVRDGLRRVAAG